MAVSSESDAHTRAIKVRDIKRAIELEREVRLALAFKE
jgi:hypothetical protein